MDTTSLIIGLVLLLIIAIPVGILAKGGKKNQNEEENHKPKAV